MKGQQSTNKNEPARKITADTALQIEDAGNQIENLASVVFMLQQAFFDGQPEPEHTQKALCHVGDALLKIRKDLDDVLAEIYQGKLEKGDE